MRNALGLMLASVVTAVVIAGVWFWTSSPRADAAPPQTIAARMAEPLLAPAAAKPALKDDVEITASLTKPAPAPAPVIAPQPAKSSCANPDALGVSRIVVIDTTGGPGFGFEHFKQLDFLTDKEVVLTFDDGPWPDNTPAVLKALADECTKGVFFAVGKHATYHPEILRQVLAAGHTVGTHTWSHVNLEQQEDDRAAGQGRDREGLQRGEDGARDRAGAVLPLPRVAAHSGGGGLSRLAQCRDVLDRRRFLRFPKSSQSRPGRQHRHDQARQAGQGHHPDARLPEAHGDALPTLLRRLKAGGYKVVQMKAKDAARDAARI